MKTQEFIQDLLKEEAIVDEFKRTPRLYVDIETHAGKNNLKLEDIKYPSNYKNEATIKAYQIEHLDEQYRSQSLKSLKGEIICIGFAINDHPAETLYRTPDKSEEELMMEFEEVVCSLSYPIWVTFNGKRFDIPWLWHRAVKYGLDKLRTSLPSRNTKGDCEDVMEAFAVTAYGSDFYYSLDDISKFLGVGAKTMDGSMVHDYYLAGKHEEIRNYCKSDVDLLRTIHKMIN